MSNNLPRILLLFYMDDQLFFHKLQWLQQYGNVDCKYIGQEVDFSDYSLVVISREHTTCKSHIGAFKVQFEEILKSKVKVLALNESAADLFILLGYSVAVKSGHMPANNVIARRHGLVSTIGTQSIYSSVCSNHLHVLLDPKQGECISYSSHAPRRVSIKTRLQSREDLELWMNSGKSIAAGTFSPFLNVNSESSYVHRNINKKIGDIPSDYILKLFLYEHLPQLVEVV